MTEKIFSLKKIIIEFSQNSKIEISEESVEKLESYLSLLKEIGGRTNLIGNLSDEEIGEYLFADSLLGLKAVSPSKGARIIDLGCGAGFPGLVLKIARPDIKLTLLDSSGKKIDFVKTVSENLSLEGVDFLCERAEVAGRDKEHREKYDIAVSKALASLPILVELTAPLVKTGGKLAAWKGEKFEKEMSCLGKHYKTLGLSEPEVFSFDVSGSGRKTIIPVFSKASGTPDRFPRSFQAIKRKPLPEL